MKKKSPLVVTLGETIFEWSFPLKSEYRTDAESFELTIEDLPPPNASRWESQAIELAINLAVKRHAQLETQNAQRAGQ